MRDGTTYGAVFWAGVVAFIAAAPLLAEDQIVRDGVARIFGASLARGATFEIEGEWELHWREFVSPGDRSEGGNDGAFVRVPGSWTVPSQDGARSPAFGFATYRCVLHIEKPPDTLAFLSPLAGTAYRMYVNGRLVSRNGRPGTTREASQPSWRRHILLVADPEEEIELLMHVSNFHQNHGGIRRPVVVGTPTAVWKSRERALAFELFLIGSLVIMTVYHFGLYILRPGDRSALYFGLFCLIIAIRTSVTGDHMYLTELIPRLPWEVLQTLIALSFVTAVPVFSLFTHSLYRSYYSTRVLHLILGVGTAFTVLVAVTPARVFSFTEQAYQVATILACVYTLWVGIAAAKSRRHGARAFLIGFAVLFATVVNDVLFGNEIIQTADLVQFGLFAFIFSQSYVLARSFSRAFNLVSEQRRKLEESEKAALQHQQQLMEADKLASLGVLVAGVAHEINNPNQSVLLNAGLLRDTCSDVLSFLDTESEDAQGYLFGGLEVPELRRTVPAALSAIEDNARRINLIVSELSSYGRRQPADDFQTFDLNAAVRSSITITSSLIKESTSECRLDLSREELPVFGSRQRIEQVVINVVQNACQAAAATSGRVRIHTRADHSRKAAVFEVSDTGGGIPAAALDRVTEPFFTTRRESGGMGMGLAVSAGIVDEHGGQLSFQSAEGTGTTVTVFLPIREE